MRAGTRQRADVTTGSNVVMMISCCYSMFYAVALLTNIPIRRYKAWQEFDQSMLWPF